ncbi:pspA/IM30 family protein [Mycobacterium kansasii]|uniref:PspA/IM30 family protein n=1 Tax=Mycobacterium kansasii TaxID=1768 RepID=A0A1V3XYU6_MYCKA|nr:pspA/IM30 family protein [Mycobacterium kansasii]
MANPFVKAWKYLMALFSSKIDEYADPKVQIQQAIEEAQRTHQALTQQAAQVIGNQRQLEMRLNRQLADIEKLQVNVRQALTLADQATAAGDAAKAAEYNNAAEAFAAQLVTAEQSVEDLKTLHDQALNAAAQAKKAVEQNSMVLQQKIAERTKLLSQLEQAKMQEQVSASLRSMSELAARAMCPASTRYATRSNAATPPRLVRPSLRNRRCRAACSRSSKPASRWPVIPGWSRSGRRCAEKPCRPAVPPVPEPPRPHPPPRAADRLPRNRSASKGI